MTVTEAEIKAITVGPRVTREDVLALIKSEEFIYTGTLTICVLTLDNAVDGQGTKLVGESACASPANYNKDIGDRLARDNAINKIWPLLGFELKQKLHLIDKAGAPSGKILELGTPVTYVGTKVAHLVAMTRQEYNDYRGWELPKDENGEDNGFLIEYTDGGAPNVPGHAGYVSWYPREVAEKAYNIGVRQEPETFISRLKKERDELVDRLAKLKAFLDSDKASGIPVEALEDLKLQHKAMTDYAFIVSKRYDELTAQ